MTLFRSSEEIDTLLKELTSYNKDGDTKTGRKLLWRAMQVSLNGIHTKKLLPHIVKFLASGDITTKKLACWHLLENVQQEDILLLGVNTLLKDCEDPNPMVRGLALKTLSNLPEAYLEQYCLEPISKGLKDQSSYVRRTAVISCIKVENSSNGTVHGSGLVDELYSLLRDSDPIVVINVINVLEEILEGEGGMVVNRNITHHLLNKLPTFTEWGLVVVFDLLHKYKPKTEEETIDVLNLGDSYLKHSNAAVVKSSLLYFLHLVQGMPQLKPEVFRRAKTQIIHFLSSGNSELVFELLIFISSLIVEYKDIFDDHYKSFFCKYNEPLYLKEKKVEILPLLANDENMKEIIEELSMYCTDISNVLVQRSVVAIGTLASLHPQHFQMCYRSLIDLLQMNIDYVSSSVLQVIKTLHFENDDMKKQLMTHIPHCVDLIRDTEGKCALLVLLGEYGEYLEDGVYILERFVDDCREEGNARVNKHLLVAVIKTFFKQPAQCHDILSKMLEICISSNDIDVQEQAEFYYNLLRAGISDAKEVICS